MDGGDLLTSLYRSFECLCNVTSAILPDEEEGSSSFDMCSGEYLATQR